MSISPISPLASGAWNKVLDATGPDSTAAAKEKPAGSAASAKDVKHAASQFEAIILRQLLAPTIEPLMSGGLGGSSAGGGGGGVYGYMLTDVLADSLSKGGGLGLSQMLVRQFTPRGKPVQEISTQSAATVPSADKNNPPSVS
ncbi:MAG: rod-binding protein [Opitutaceae bacterium]|nr:rod-binding protein [Opitutaceae bacterium]